MVKRRSPYAPVSTGTPFTHVARGGGVRTPHRGPAGDELTVLSLTDPLPDGEGWASAAGLAAAGPELDAFLAWDEAQIARDHGRNGRPDVVATFGPRPRRAGALPARTGPAAPGRDPAVRGRRGLPRTDRPRRPVAAHLGPGELLHVLHAGPGGHLRHLPAHLRDGADRQTHGRRHHLTGPHGRPPALDLPSQPHPHRLTGAHRPPDAVRRAATPR